MLFRSKTGSVDASKLGAIETSDPGRLSGNLKRIATYAKTVPKATQVKVVSSSATAATSQAV